MGGGNVNAKYDHPHYGFGVSGVGTPKKGTLT